jgi:hypothetical protein
VDNGNFISSSTYFRSFNKWVKEKDILEVIHGLIKERLGMELQGPIVFMPFPVPLTSA